MQHEHGRGVACDVNFTEWRVCNLHGQVRHSATDRRLPLNEVSTNCTLAIFESSFGCDGNHRHVDEFLNSRYELVLCFASRIVTEGVVVL